MQSPRAFRTVGISASKQESFFQALGRDPTQSTFPPELCLNVIIREILSLHKTFFSIKKHRLEELRKSMIKKGLPRPKVSEILTSIPGTSANVQDFFWLVTAWCHKSSQNCIKLWVVENCSRIYSSMHQCMSAKRCLGH